jgi:hypothetical protein
MVTLESARTATPGETVATVRGAVYSAIFDPGVDVATLGLRLGIVDGTELDVEASHGLVVGNDEVTVPRNISAGRVGVKHRLGSSHMAVMGGVGGGYAPSAGSFVAADMGLVKSYDNCYLLPFVAYSFILSAPVGAKSVNLGEGNYATAKLTYGFGGTGGLEIPLDHSRCREGKIPARIQLGLSMQLLDDGHGKTTKSCGECCETTTSGGYLAFGLAAGLEIPF